MKPVPCPICGAVFTPRRASHRFCSNRCSALRPGRPCNGGPHPRHGHARVDGHSRTYTTWRAMRKRCEATTGEHARLYRDRGITVCARWQTFENFLADMGERPAGTTLDRIDNAKGYEPGNCRWATPVQQTNNKRSNHRLELAGESLTISEWARRLGIDKRTLLTRVRRGWPTERVLSTPARPHVRGNTTEAM